MWPCPIRPERWPARSPSSSGPPPRRASTASRGSPARSTPTAWSSACPVTLRGERGEQAEATERFVAALRETLPEVEIETWDERFTTRLAEASADAGARGEEDALAAAHLLSSYLEWLSASRT